MENQNMHRKCFAAMSMASTAIAATMTFSSALANNEISGDVNKESPILIATSDDYELGKMAPTAPSGPLTKEQLPTLLDKRVPPVMDLPFIQFTQMLLVPIQPRSGAKRDGQAISLASTSDKIAKTFLRSPFPEFYRPTLRQFLDEIAWQTNSNWKYNADEKNAQKKLEGNKQDIKQVAIFDFSEAERAKPYEITMAHGWTKADKGSWVMYSPAGSDTSMDVYEMGTYTSQDKSAEPELLKKVPQELALEWARKVKPKAKLTDFSARKVSNHDAIFFETSVKSQAKKDVHWRQWLFMDGEQCYFIVSTLYPDVEAKLLPDVEAMLKSFHSK